jgi:hypothetical protein
VEHLLGVPLWDRLLSLAANITIGWKRFPGANTLAYLVHLQDRKKKKVCEFGH